MVNRLDGILKNSKTKSKNNFLVKLAPEIPKDKNSFLNRIKKDLNLMEDLIGDIDNSNGKINRTKLHKSFDLLLEVKNDFERLEKLI